MIWFYPCKSHFGWSFFHISRLLFSLPFGKTVAAWLPDKTGDIWRRCAEGSVPTGDFLDCLVEKQYLWLVNGCLEYHQPVITIACPPKRSQKWLHRKLVPISLIVSGVGNWTECAAVICGLSSSVVLVFVLKGFIFLYVRYFPLYFDISNSTFQLG